MNNQFLIPANSKRSLLYFGVFNLFDMILFGSGVMVSLIAVMIIPSGNMVATIIALTPGVVSGFLVLPIPNYYNVRTILKSVYRFLTTRQKFIWKGWDYLNETNESK